jgi:hypothetical protein
MAEAGRAHLKGPGSNAPFHGLAINPAISLRFLPPPDCYRCGTAARRRGISSSNPRSLKH